MYVEKKRRSIIVSKLMFFGDAASVRDPARDLRHVIRPSKHGPSIRGIVGLHIIQLFDSLSISS